MARENRPVIVLSLGLGMLGMATSMPASALEAFKIYDNFNASAIDQARWPNQLERTREIVGGSLRLMARDYGRTDSNLGAAGVSQHQAMLNPASITEIRSTVTVDKVDTIGCAGNAVPTESRARIYGIFFNTGNAGAGGDVEAQMRLVRRSNSSDPAGVLRVDAVVRLCADAACDSTTDLATADFGTVSLGQAVRMQMRWDQPKNRFLFSRDDQPAVALNYSVADGSPAHDPFMSISIRNTVPACTGSPRPTGMIDARFNDVSINKSAVP